MSAVDTWGLGVLDNDSNGPNDDLLERLFSDGLTDGLPCVPPTHPRVARMLEAVAHVKKYSDPTNVLGECAPSYNDVTVAHCAAAAVMAGCQPKQFVVVLAAVEAMLSEAFNLHGVSATTMGATPCVIVNGPVRTAAGLNSGIGALGSSSRANASIGRALKLVLQNVGEAKLGGTESTTIGSPNKFTLCLAEFEEHLSDSDWEPLHVGRGFTVVDSAVTVVAVTAGPIQLVDFNTTDARKLVELLAGIMVSECKGDCTWYHHCSSFYSSFLQQHTRHRTFFLFVFFSKGK